MRCVCPRVDDGSVGGFFHCCEAKKGKYKCPPKGEGPVPPLGGFAAASRPRLWRSLAWRLRLPDPPGCAPCAAFAARAPAACQLATSQFAGRYLENFQNQGKRSAPGRRQAPVGKCGGRCGHVGKACLVHMSMPTPACPRVDTGAIGWEAQCCGQGLPCPWHWADPLEMPSATTEVVEIIDRADFFILENQQLGAAGRVTNCDPR